VATVVSRLVVYAAEVIGTVGLATPLVVEQVASLCASSAARIARWLRDLLASLRRLMHEGQRLGELIGALAPGNGRGVDVGAATSRAAGSPYDDFAVEDLVSNGGAKVGRPGRGRNVREVPTEEDLRSLFAALTRNGYTDITPPGFYGRMVRLSDGTVINWRTISRTTSGLPTVDVNTGASRFKVHVNGNGW
jgi:hypothetical protein